LDPIIFGEYPPVMQKILGDILPKFSNNNKEKLKSGLDFIGINHYASYYIKDCIYSKCEPGPGITRTEGLFQQSAEKDGVPIGKPVHIFNLT
jgi:beta-glucosidase